MPLFVTLTAAGVTCRVPFSFSVNGKTLPAGSYSLTTREGILKVNGPRASATAMTRQAPAKDEPGMKLVFLKTGDRYELIEAWTGGKFGLEIRRSGERRAGTSGERVVIPIK